MHTASVRTRYTFFIDADLREALRKLNVRDGISESEAIRRALADYLTRRKVLRIAKGGRRPTK
jgi:hypothetical protein